MLSRASIRSSPSYKWWVFGCVAVGIYMAVLDGSIVNVALPAIADTFSISLSAIQWVVIAYLMAISIFLLPLGRLADRVGRKPIYLIGFVTFVVGSMLSGIAPDIVSLSLARVLQAIGGASLQATGISIATAAFPANERGRALGMIATVVAQGAITGPTVGGVIVDGAGWRWIFFINAPIGAVGLFLATTILRDDRAEARAANGAARGFDWLGSILSGGALVLLLLALTKVSQWGWGSPLTLGCLGGAVALGAAFLRAERRPDPMIELKIFKVQAFSAGVFASFCQFTAMAAFGLLLPFYLQRVLGYSARSAGLMLLPFPFMLAIFGPLCGRLSEKVSVRLLASAGLLVAGTGLLGCAFLGTNSGLGQVMFWQVVIGIGMGSFGPPNNNAIFSSIPRSAYGVTAAVTTLARNLGQTIGVAVATLVVAAAMTHAGYAPQLSASSADDSPGSLSAFATGMHYAFYLAAGLSLIAMFASLIRGPRHMANDEAASAPAATSATRA